MSNKADILKQMEYYLSDKNLAIDKFFREEIEKGKNGYVDLTKFMQCNKIKQMEGISIAKIVEACAGSKEVEISKDKKQVRRVNNKELPEKQAVKKRDAKGADKEEKKKGDANGTAGGKEAEAENDEPVQRDEQGRIIFHVQDFENPLILHFATKDQNKDKDEEYKVNWKDIEKLVKENYEKLKVVYSRADKYEGDLAISSHKLNKAQYATLSTL